MKNEAVIFISGLVCGFLIAVIPWSIKLKVETKKIYEKGIESGVVEKYIDGDSIKYRFIYKAIK